MATSPGYGRVAGKATHPLTDVVFDALREAVLVIDAEYSHLPVLMANSAAKRCLMDNSPSALSSDRSLYPLLGPATAAAMDGLLASLSAGKPRANRVLMWRFPGGDKRIVTEMNLLTCTPAQRCVMLKFPDPLAEPADAGILSAVEQPPLDMMILDRDLTVTYASAGAARRAGGSGVVGYSALTVLPTSALPRAALMGALSGLDHHDNAVAVQMPGAATRWFEVDLLPLKDESGIIGIAVLSTEVTERRLRRRAAGSDQRGLPALTEHAGDVITVAGREGNVQYVSGGLANALGYTVAERLSSSIFEHMHPSDVAALRTKYAQLATGEIGTFSWEYRVRHRDGSYRWLESSYRPVLGNGLMEGVVIDSRDITARKQAENHLAQREEVFRLAADAVSGIIFEWDLERSVVHRSRGVYDVLEIQPSEVAAAGAWLARIHPQDRAAHDRRIAGALKGGRGWTATYRIRDGRGRYRSILERALIQRGAEGDPLRAIGCAVDVSEIKRLTDLLAETQRAAKMGAWEYSYATRAFEWTDEMFRIYETRPEDFTVSWASMLERCTPDSRQRLTAAIDTAEAADGNMDLELEITTLAERQLWVRLIGHVEKLDGKPFRAYGSVQNIQAQKLSQIALENSTEWLKLSINMAHMQAWRWNRPTDTLEFAIMEGQMVHRPGMFPGIKRLMTRVHPGDRPGVRRAIDKAFERHEEVHEEFRLKSHDGQYRAYAAVARPLFDAAHQPTGLVGVTRDVTAQRAAEARLRGSEEVLRTITANTGDALLLLDGDLRIRFINRSLCGMSIEDMVGQHISILLPEPVRAYVIGKLAQVVTTLETADYEFEVRSHEGNIQYFENRAVRVRGDGVRTNISLTVRDITERKRLEQEILDVSSRERQTIGRDLHDGLGQELTGVALMLRGLAKRIQKRCPDSIDHVNEIVLLVNQSIETARSLARGLMPVNKDGAGLAFSLRALAERSHALYGFQVQFRAKVLPDLALSETTASHLYRIAQEALTNTARHGRASAAAIFLLLTEEKFLLRISDNGVGLGAPSETTPGMGLKIMKYRASMIGARFEIVPNRPHGTVVRVRGECPMTATLQSAHAT